MIEQTLKIANAQCFVLFLFCFVFFGLFESDSGYAHNKPRLEYFVLQGQKYNLHKLT